MAEPYLEITVPEPLIIGLEKINNDNHEQQAKIVDFPSKEEEDLDFIDRLAKKYGMSLDDSVFIRKYVFANVDTQLRFDQHWENTKIGNEPQKVLFKFDMAEPKVTDSTDAYLLCDVGTPKLTAMNKPEIDVFNRLYLIDFDDNSLEKMITKYSISSEDVASIHVYIMKEIKAQKMVNTGFTNFVPYVNANEQENKTGRKIG